MTRRLLTLAALLLATQAGAIPQPCATLASARSVLEGGLCAEDNTLVHFFSAGFTNNVDPRFTIALAKYRSDTCTNQCTKLHNNPFQADGLTSCLADYPTIAEAITLETQKIGAWLSLLGLTSLHDAILIGAGVMDPRPMTHWFVDMFGDPSRPITYSSSCCGDCNYDHHVDINELIYSVYSAIAFNWQDFCPAPPDCILADGDRDGRIEIWDLIRANTAAIDGCPAP